MNKLEWFDSHTHPPVGEDEKADAFCLAAKEASVTALLASSAHLKSAQSYAALSLRHEHLWFGAGLHPHDAQEQGENPFEAFDVFRGHPKLAAVGEIGLDYFYGFSGREIQLKTFEYFLALALQWHKPAIIHCRDKTPDGTAYEECFERLKDFTSAGGRFVLHCFAGTVAYAERAWEMGGYTGVTGMVTFSAAENIREWVRAAPADRLLLETDSPYLAPVPHRGKPNSSVWLPLVGEGVARVRGVSPEQVASETFDNTKRLFGV